MPGKKKVIDVYFPKRGNEEKKALAELREKKKITLSGKKPKLKLLLPKIALPKPKRPRFFKSRNFLIVGLPILLLGLVFFCARLSRADIEIIPESEVLKFTINLTVDESIQSADILNNAIPGKRIEEEKTVSAEFSATGKIIKKEKAEGMIRVYNEYSTADQVLVATTRFVSTDGKLFRTPARVVIPGAHYEGGNLVPGEIDLKVVADEPGPEYNIKPTTFSIPGFAGTARYTKFYAKSFQDMTGGFSAEVLQVTEEDLEKAEYELAEKAKKACINSFKEKFNTEEALNNYDFVGAAIKTEIVNAVSSKKTEEEGDSFIFSVKIKARTIAFKKDDLNELAKGVLLTDIVEGKEVYDKSLITTLAPQTINLEVGKIVFATNLEGKVYSDINIEELPSRLKGKTILESKLILEDLPGVIRANIEFSPFWVKKVPEDASKVNINLNLD